MPLLPRMAKQVHPRATTLCWTAVSLSERPLLWYLTTMRTFAHFRVSVRETAAPRSQIPAVVSWGCAFA
eukprot:10716745-Lingulodinium_polyedra.AAC.1